MKSRAPLVASLVLLLLVAATAWFLWPTKSTAPAKIVTAAAPAKPTLPPNPIPAHRAAPAQVMVAPPPISHTDTPPADTPPDAILVQSDYSSSPILRNGADSISVGSLNINTVATPFGSSGAPIITTPASSTSIPSQVPSLPGGIQALRSTMAASMPTPASLSAALTATGPSFPPASVTMDGATTRVDFGVVPAVANTPVRLALPDGGIETVTVIPTPDGMIQINTQQSRLNPNGSAALASATGRVIPATPNGLYPISHTNSNGQSSTNVTYTIRY